MMQFVSRESHLLEATYTRNLLLLVEKTLIYASWLIKVLLMPSEEEVACDICFLASNSLLWTVLKRKMFTFPLLFHIRAHLSILQAVFVCTVFCLQVPVRQYSDLTLI